MMLRKSPFLMVVLLLLARQALGIESTAPDPLFASDEVLQVRIYAPIAKLQSERPTDEEFPARIEYSGSIEAAAELDIKIRARGRFRHRPDICDFPPLRLNVKKSTAVGTLFENQNKLKLVTHCRDSSSNEQLVLREYLAYKLLNAMTDASLRVRLIRVTYVDTERGDKAGHEHNGFIIEHANRLAARFDMTSLDVPRLQVLDLSPEHTNLYSVFQYLIGNTDFSPLVGNDGESCCHNYMPFDVPGKEHLAIPYDFDQAGIVNAPYAAPNPRFRLRSVRQRLYRGRCQNNDQLPATLEQFTEKRVELLQLVEAQEGLTKSTRKSMLSYINEFYKIVDNEKQLQKRIVKACI